MTTPLVSIDTQHEDMIHDAQLDYYAKRLATCSSDRSIKIYQVEGDGSYTQTQIITQHDGPVWQITWAHPKFGVILASCSYDSNVLIHREAPQNSWNVIERHEFHRSSVNSIAWAPHEFGLILACASADGQVSIIENSGSENQWPMISFQDSPLGVNSVSWAPYNTLGGHSDDGRPIMRLVTGSCDNQVRIWRRGDSESKDDNNNNNNNINNNNKSNNGWIQEPISTDICHSDWVRDVAWAPNTGMPCNIIASCSEDRTVLIWTQSELNQPWSAILLNTFENPVWRVSWSLTGNVLAVSSGDQQVTLWKQSVDGTWRQISSVDEQGVGASGN